MLVVVALMLLCVHVAADVATVTPLGSSANAAHRVAVIGASGFVGSRLHAFLAQHGIEVVGYDREPLEPSGDNQTDWLRTVVHSSAESIPDADLTSFDAVVYLGGLSGRKQCDEQPAAVHQENVGDVWQVARRMRPSQLLVFASTSAIAEGSGEVPVSEGVLVRVPALDLYAASMHHREHALRALSESEPLTTPPMVGLRFGTVVGQSPSQRTDLLHTALVCSAVMTGHLRITHPETSRSVLAVEDLEQAVLAILHTDIASQGAQPRFRVYNLASFATTVTRAAAEVAARTGAMIEAIDHAPKGLDIPGFSINTTAFTQRYGISLVMTERAVVERLYAAAPVLCMGRSRLVPRTPRPTKSHQHRDSIAAPLHACAVCGSTDLMTVLDLHEQPLANDFRTSAEAALDCPRYPLRLARCRHCHHTQLSHVVDRKTLFDSYLYASGTSRTLANYFEWLADKVSEETRTRGFELNGRDAAVLEIASNDGSQLDSFRQRGWRTFGFDPARNLADEATARGHTIVVGYWGVDEAPAGVLPPRDEIAAIVAQNVLAHVPDPVAFTRACAAAMGPRTRLYLQTSQCEMFETGQFDTVYHEHVSFFTAHSFAKLAQESGLRITGFEITPIHGRSCLVTMERVDQIAAYNGTAISSALASEALRGMTSDWFYVLYRHRAEAMRAWMHSQLESLQARGFSIAGYGAAAKGMVLLHWLNQMRGSAYNISFVIDDSTLKQGRFCPGTSIPVEPSSVLATERVAQQPLVLVVFAWNFFEEIASRVCAAAKGSSRQAPLLGLVPFPEARLVDLGASCAGSTSVQPLLRLPFSPTPWPEPFVIGEHLRRRVLLVSRVASPVDIDLLSYFVRHYAPLVDAAVVVAADESAAATIAREAPNSWIVDRNSSSAVSCDKSQFAGWWCLSLPSTSEFLVSRHLRASLARESAQQLAVPGIRVPVHLPGDAPLQRFRSLVKQRSRTREPLAGETRALVVVGQDSSSASLSEEATPDLGVVLQFQQLDSLEGPIVDLASPEHCWSQHRLACRTAQHLATLGL